jgi:hypothetical protein
MDADNIGAARNGYRHAPEYSSSGCLRTRNGPFLIHLKTVAVLTDQSFAALPVVKWSDLLLSMWAHPDFMGSISCGNYNSSNTISIIDFSQYRSQNRERP